MIPADFCDPARQRDTTYCGRWTQSLGHCQKELHGTDIFVECVNGYSAASLPSVP